MRIIALMAGLILVATPISSHAQGGTQPGPPQGSNAPVKDLKNVTQLKVQVTFSRYQAEKKTGAVTYTLPVSTGGERSEIRMGLQVPLRFEGKEFPGNVVFKSVGTSIKCTAEGAGEGRYQLNCALEQSSLYEDPAEKPGVGAVPPAIRSFSSDATLLLRDGQSAQHLLATDPLTGDVLRVDVTLSVMK